MQAHHHSLQEASYPDIQDSLQKFDNLNKAEALTMAAGYGLSPLGTLNDIQNSIILHITEGVCCRSQAILPPACAKLWAQCPNEFSEMPDSNSDTTNEMHIFLLSQLSKKIQ